MINYFVFKGIDSRVMGILIKSAPNIQRPKERITQVTIPGRAGTLTLTEGDEAFEPYIQTITCAVPANEMHRVSKWLMGEGELILSCEPDRYQIARVTALINFVKISKHIDKYQGSIQFTCQPFKMLNAKHTDWLTQSGTLTNTGDVTEKPIIKLYGTGNLSITVNGNAFEVANAVKGVVIDIDTQEVLNLEGTKILTADSTGDFPVFKTGRNVISFIGEQIAVERRERFL